MALTTTSIANTLVSQSRAAQTGRQRGDAVGEAFKRSGERTERQLESSRVQLSAFGQVKSAFADLEAKAKGLGEPKKTATAAETGKAVEAFVAAYNNAAATVGNATRGEGPKAGALAGEGRAQVAAADLRQALSSGNTRAELQKLGVTQDQNGTLTVNAAALNQAFQANPDQTRATLARIGGQVGEAVGREVAGTGNLGGAVDAVARRTAALATRQAEEQRAAEQAQQTIAQQGGQIVNAANGLAAYQKLLSG